MSIIEGLRFSQQDTAIHNLDPRVKFFLTIVFFSSAIMFMRLIPLILLFSIQIPIIIIDHYYLDCVFLSKRNKY